MEAKDVEQNWVMTTTLIFEHAHSEYRKKVFVEDPFMICTNVKSFDPNKEQAN